MRRANFVLILLDFVVLRSLARVKRGYQLILHFAVGCLMNRINAHFAQSLKHTVQNYYQKSVTFFFFAEYILETNK